MKLELVLTHTTVHTCTIDVPLGQAREAIEKLTHDDFKDTEQFSCFEVLDENNQDLSFQIQPYTPNLL